MGCLNTYVWISNPYPELADPAKQVLHIPLSLHMQRPAPPPHLPRRRRTETLLPLRHVRHPPLLVELHNGLRRLGQRARLPPAAVRDPHRTGLPARLSAHRGAEEKAGVVDAICMGVLLAHTHHGPVLRGGATRRGVGAAAGAGERVEGPGWCRGGVVGVEEGYACGVEAVVGVG